MNTLPLILICFDLCASLGDDVSYFDLSQIERSDYSDRNDKYVDIYTNYPDTESVLENYNRATKSIISNGWQQHGDYLMKNSDPFAYNSDAIESEYGTFVTESVRYSDQVEMQTNPPETTTTRRGLNDYNKRRPKFKTTKRGNVTNVQKITRRRVPNGNKKISGVFRKYIKRLNGRNNNRTRKQENVKSKFLDDHLTAIKNKTISIANKLFSLFTIIQFPNSLCQATSASSSYEGTCYHRSECERINGTAIGDCANGYGVCCVFRNTCGESSSQNCTYFESPGYPNYNPPDGSVVPPTIAPTLPPNATPDPRIKIKIKDVVYYHHYARQSRQDDSVSTSLRCVFMVSKTSENVQQMRIDFIDLELKGPTNGTCIDERLIITGQNVNDPVPVICGYNTGQHVYVDVGNLQGPLQISVLANQVERKRYKLRVCQLSSSCAGNMNCLQYYTGVTGTISTFNYDQSAILARSRPGYFNNLNYAICIRKEAGYCSVTYTNVQNRTEYPFELVNIDNAGQSIVPAGQAGAEIFNCPEDYIIIDGIRLCGYKLNDGSVVTDFTMNAPVTDTSGGPIIIPVRTDGSVTGRGFKLFYMQNRCPPS